MLVPSDLSDLSWSNEKVEHPTSTWTLCIVHIVPPRFRRSLKKGEIIEVMGVYSSLSLAQKKREHCLRYYLEHGLNTFELEIREQALDCDLWCSETEFL